MRKIKFPMLLSLALCFPLALSSCNSGDSPAQTTTTAMGRYVEESVELPPEMIYLESLQAEPDGSLLLLGYTGKSTGGLSAWTLENGAAWTSATPDWLEEARKYQLYETALDGDGGLWFTHIPADDDNDATPPLMRIRDGAADPVDLELKHPGGNVAESLVITASGDILSSYNYSLLVHDGNTLRQRYELTSGTWLDTGFYFASGTTLAVSDTGAIKLYDLATGTLRTELPVQAAPASNDTGSFFEMFNDRTAIAPAPDGAYCYCNVGGIYRVSADGLLTERVVNGEQSSLAMPTLSVRQLVAAGDDYYVYCVDEANAPHLFRYRYDETVATVPSAELRVYALEDSPTIRQAAGIFQRENPDVRVRFEVALSDGSTLPNDALQALSTELLAGTGPDLLVLDGMPIDDYRQKGILADLGALLAPELQAGLLANIASAYEADGTLQALPARFTLPMILATEEVAAETATLSGLADFLAGQESPQIGVPPDQIIDLLYPVFHREWFRADGSFDEEACTRGLADLARILSLYGGKDPADIWDAAGDPIAGALGWSDDWIPFFIAPLTSMDSLVGPYSAINVRGEGAYTPYPRGSGGIFYPRVVLGINASSGNRELAGSFVACALSEDVQSRSLADGLPVNRAALAAAQECPPELSSQGASFQRYGISFEDVFRDGEERQHHLEAYWPDAVFLAGVNDAIDSADTPVMVNRTVVEIFNQETAAFFAGGSSLEDTMTALRQKLDIYLAE